MNILHIVLALHTGGLERVVLDLIQSSKSSSKAFVCCLDDIGEYGSELERMGVSYFELGNFGKHKLKTIFAIRKIITSNEIDVIHTHNPSPQFYGCLAGVLSATPVIHTKHGRNYPGNRWMVLKNYLFSLLSFKIVCVSSDAAQVARDVEKIPENKIITILNGIDVPKYSKKDLLSQNTLIAVGDITLGIVARLSAEKDHDTLLHAVVNIVSVRKDFLLLIIGDGPLRRQLEVEVKKLNIEKFCHFLGNRQDIPALLSVLDIFVLCSTTEGVSLTLLEAMASALPIVCTDVGGNPEVVKDKETGIIVPSKNDGALADAILELMNNSDLRESMGNAGYERVSQKFNINNTAKRYDSLYRSAVGGV